MSAPTKPTRNTMYLRDALRCVSCGSPYDLEHQHRAATGMGGSKKRPTIEESLTTCSRCNPRYEGDMQLKALACGWKVRRWVRDHTRVPVFYWLEMAWYRIDRDGRRHIINSFEADRMMRDVYGDEYTDFTESMSERSRHGHQ